ncbi:noncanonical pyrimidine nucleotidase, YjjG family [Weissella cibaria]|uniref:YjjG family noncanonical pyrimidine nucleotidase n=1 Tax=Weissella cibaria TaxID=137591 RepID=UPI001192799D|nr:YjjG family noncanonical pyrimidine nucleotidase [Weissella cibaria]MCT8399287.1 noncanonical pyrimidine nucleotidase, YjjG family [Weissella cibaria]TVV24705.1 noncanonical pyrimidine nucleotidase, YjjG family [Weissella cibaria]TVV31904.1 noncanonical pyrimidine nucleotidase, YjjG family [Weissella cibaria]
MYKHLIFDLDDTLLDFRKGEAVGLLNVFRDHEVPDVRQAFDKYQQINRGLWSAYERGEISKDQIHNTRFATLFDQFGRDVDGVALEKEYRGYLNENYYVLDGAEALLQQLTKQGYKLIAGTNGEQHTQEQRMAHTGFMKYFDDMVTSDEIGHAKPATEFFDAIFNKQPAMTRSNTIMIGDGLASDIQGGNRYHLDTLWVNLHQVANNTPYQATYEVNQLDTIPDIVRR